MESFSSYTLSFGPFSPPDQTSSPSSSGTTHQGNSDEEAIATVDTSPPKRRAGRTKFRETRHPLYKGVRQRNGGKWVCEVREPFKKSRIWLGTYPTAEMAARAHDVAAMALRGRAACLNFSDSVWLLRVPPSGSVKEIQKAASEAAEAFRPAASKSEISRSSGEEPEEKSEIGEQATEQAGAAAAASPPTMDVFYMDEEAVFDMPRLLTSMAEGLLLSPPPPSSPWDDVEVAADVSLWSYSI